MSKKVAYKKFKQLVDIFQMMKMQENPIQTEELAKKLPTSPPSPMKSEVHLSRIALTCAYTLSDAAQ